MKHPLDKIDEIHTELKALLPLNADVEQKLHKKFRLEFNYNSNHLEGNTLTYSETELLLIFDDTKGNHTLREYEEMKAHDVAYQTIEDWAKDAEHELTERDIRNLNQLILVRDFWKDAITPDGQSTRRKIKVGEYKEHPNSVRLQNGEMFHYTAPGDVPAAMQELMQWYRDERAGLHPLTLAAMFHYKFVCIHPFDDGNGRLARLLMNYVLLKYGYPPVVIKSKGKTDYLRALNRADAGIYEDFISYISEQETWSLETYLKAARGESIEEPDDLDKELSLLKRELGESNILSIQASSEEIIKAIETNLIPLFKLVEEKCSELKEYFFDFDRRLEAQVNSGSEVRIGDKTTTWGDIVQNWLYNQVRNEGKSISRMRHNFQLSGFKKHSSAPAFWTQIEVRFNDYNYILETPKNRNNGLTIPYGQVLSLTEQLELVSPMVRDIMEGMKQHNNSPK